MESSEDKYYVLGELRKLFHGDYKSKSLPKNKIIYYRLSPEEKQFNEPSQIHYSYRNGILKRGPRFVWYGCETKEYSTVYELCFKDELARKSDEFAKRRISKRIQESGTSYRTEIILSGLLLIALYLFSLITRT